MRVSELDKRDELWLMCAAPSKACANGRTFPTETETRGPNKKLWRFALALRLEQAPPITEVHVGFTESGTDP